MSDAPGEQPAEPLAPDAVAALSAAADDLRLLALLNDREATPDLIAELRLAPVMTRFSVQPNDEDGRAAFQILDAALQSEECDGSQARMDLLAADFAAIYLNHALSVSPTEGTFVEPEGLDRQEPMFEVRRWYTHYGVQAADWRRRPDDHLAHQLQFIAHLLDAPTNDAPKDAAAFMDHHVLRWVDHFASRVAQRCDTQFYAGVTLTTAAILKNLRRQLVDLVGMPLVEMEPIEEEKRRRREQAQEAAAKFIPGDAPSW